MVRTTALAPDFLASAQSNPGGSSFLGQKGNDFPLPEPEPFFPFQRRPHPALVGIFVDLGAESPHRRPLARIEPPDLEVSRVGRPPHLAAQGIDLLDQMALGGAADRGIAGHPGDVAQIQEDQPRAGAHARAGQGRFAPRMPSAHHQQIEPPRHPTLSFDKSHKLSYDKFVPGR